jgi:D-sedoheptulose 7-phosphate isomerase
MNNVDKFFTKNVVEFSRNYLDYLKVVLDSINTNEIEEFVKSLLEARSRGAMIFFAGNGGSAATSSHFANDISIGANSYKKPFRALSLSDNQAIITAIGNDFGYEEIFLRQIMTLGKSGDVFVAISASGNSPNLVKAVDYSNRVGIKTVSITAFDGGKLKELSDVSIHVKTALKEYGPAEDAHMVLDHLIGAYLMRLCAAE